jgi:AraC-like DNA-binding protein
VSRKLTRPVAVGLLPHLRRAHDHIDRHYQAPLDLDQLAQVAGVSKFHFVRSFEATYGETPIRYLTRRRIERAQDLLRAANLTVTEVCMIVGFASLGSFSSRFAQLVGESPPLTATGGPPAAARTSPGATCSCAARWSPPARRGAARQGPPARRGAAAWSRLRNLGEAPADRRE